MADKDEETSAVTRNETSPNTFWKGLAELLKAHHEVLYSLPEMCERFAEIDWKTTPGAVLQAPYRCREEEVTVLDKQNSKADLKVTKHLKKQMTIKHKRITTLKRESKQKDGEIELLKKLCEKLKTDVEIKDGQLKECSERCASFERKLHEKEEEITFANAQHATLEIEIETKKKENESMNKKNEELKMEFEKKNQKLNEFSQRIAFLEKKLYEKGREVLLAKKGHATLEIELEEKKKENESMGRQNKRLKEKCRELLKQKDEELNKLKNRLAYLSEKQVMKDQRQVEDTTASNRPSEVEKDFSAFFDEDRVDVCDKLPELYGSEEEIDVKIYYPRLACMIFETAYEEMKDVRDAVAEFFENVMNNMTASAPVKAQEYCLWKEKGEEGPFPMGLDLTVSSQQIGNQTDILDTLMLSLKETSHVCDLTPLQPKVTSKVMGKWKEWLTNEKSCTFSFSEQLLGQLKDYIQACIRLSWRIVTQVPPMQLEYHSSILGNIHKNRGYNASPERHPTVQPGDEQYLGERRSEMQPEDEQYQGEDNSIACYLWPGLLDGGGRLIRAGEVLCHREKVTMV